MRYFYQTQKAPLWWCEFDRTYRPHPAILARVATGLLVDDSWHNDICPHFHLKASEDVWLWCDHPIPGRREMGGSRYMVTVDEGDGSIGHVAYEGDDVEIALAYVEVRCFVDGRPLAPTLAEIAKDVPLTDAHVRAFLRARVGARFEYMDMEKCVVGLRRVS